METALEDALFQTLDQFRNQVIGGDEKETRHGFADFFTEIILGTWPASNATYRTKAMPMIQLY